MSGVGFGPDGVGDMSVKPSQVRVAVLSYHREPRTSQQLTHLDVKKVFRASIEQIAPRYSHVYRCPIEVCEDGRPP